MMPDELPQPARPVLKRPRPVLSCFECRRKKLKCDRLLPCQQCLKLGQPSGCKYAPGQEPEVRGDGQSFEVAKKKLRYKSPTESSPQNVEQISDLHDRVRKLEQALRLQQTPDSTQDIQSNSVVQITAPSSTRGTSVDVEHAATGPVVYTTNEELSLFEKFEEFNYFIILLKQRLHLPDIQSISLQLHAINDAVTQHELVKPGLISSNTYLPHLIEHMTRLLPAPHVRDKLIELYFEHFEHCMRIVHKPKFLSMNGDYNSGILDQTQIEYFVPALMCVLSIASNLGIYPECDLPALHGHLDGIGAIQLIDSWYENVARRDGVSVPAIQVRLLAMQLQRYQHTKLTELWASSGQLIRQAMIQGLHTEAIPKLSNHEAEMRRCLWLSILEQDLALAISCELPPQCPSYHLMPPSNCDDSELSEISSATPPQHPTDRWTDGLCQHILGTTFNQRLEAYKHRFAPRSPSHYTKTMDHARSLGLTIRELPALFRLDHLADNAANTPGRLLAQMDLDITLRRSIIATYAPYARMGPKNDVPQEVRVQWTQSNLVVICFQDLFDPQYPAIDVPIPVGYWNFFYTAYRYDVMQSLESMLHEAKHLKQASAPFSDQEPDILDQDAGNSVRKIPRWNLASMLGSIQDTLEPMRRRVGASNESLQVVLRYGILYDSLRAPSNTEVEEYVMDGMRTSLTTMQKRLEREGYTIAQAGEPLEGLHHQEWLIEFLTQKPPA